MSALELKPCPFCGTRLDDPDKPASEIHGGGFTFECGECGANWPRIQQEDVSALSDEGIAAIFNRRTPPSAPAVPSGMVLVPVSALKWLNGEGPDADGHWFGDAPDDGKRGAFWWRSKFSRMLTAAQEGR